MKETAPASLDHDLGFRVVMVGSSALGSGALLASLTVIRQGRLGIEFVWSNLAIPAFLLGALLCCGFWWLVFRLEARQGDEQRQRRRLLVASAALLLLAFGAFIYPMRFVVPERRTDVLIGLGAAIAVLSVVGFMIRTVVKWLEEEADQTDSPAPPHHDS